jgi:hypothetical protein
MFTIFFKNLGRKEDFAYLWRILVKQQKNILSAEFLNKGNGGTILG